MCCMFIITNVQLQMDTDGCPHEPVTGTPGLWLLTRWPWYTHTHESLWWDVRCSMFPCLCCDLWRCSCWLCTLYSIVHQSQYSGPRYKIHLEQQQQRRLSQSVLDTAARDHLPGLGPLTTLPKLFRIQLQHSSLFSHCIKRTWGTSTHLCGKGSHEAFEPSLLLSLDKLKHRNNWICIQSKTWKIWFSLYNVQVSLFVYLLPLPPVFNTNIL